MINSHFIIVLICSALSLLGYSCNEAKFMQGKRTYDIMCGDCHMEDGSGVAKLYPQLTQEHLATLLDELPCLIREGIDRPESLIKMPPNPSLQPVDITNIINYICNDLFEINEEFTMTQIEQALIQCPQE